MQKPYRHQEADRAGGLKKLAKKKKAVTRPISKGGRERGSKERNYQVQQS